MSLAPLFATPAAAALLRGCSATEDAMHVPVLRSTKFLTLIACGGGGGCSWTITGAQLAAANARFDAAGGDANEAAATATRSLPMLVSEQSPASLAAVIAAHDNSLVATALARESCSRLRISVAKRDSFELDTTTDDGQLQDNNKNDDDDEYVLVLFFVDSDNGLLSTVLDVEIVPQLSPRLLECSRKAKRRVTVGGGDSAAAIGDPEPGASLYLFPIAMHPELVHELSSRILPTVSAFACCEAQTKPHHHHHQRERRLLLDPVPPPTLHFFAELCATKMRRRTVTCFNDDDGIDDVFSLHTTRDHPLLAALCAHQRKAVRFACRGPASAAASARPVSCLIGDSPGGGKTLSALGVIAARGTEASLPLLIVCPALARVHWASHCEQWLGVRPDRIAVVFDSGGAPAEQQQAAVTIISFTMLVRLFESHFAHLPLGHFRTIIVDESHNIRPPSLTTTTATASSSSLQATCCARLIARQACASLLFLSGTPFVARPFDIFAQVQMLCPGLLCGVRNGNGNESDGGGGLEFCCNYLVSTFSPFFAPGVACHRPEELRLLLAEAVLVRTDKEDPLMAAEGARRLAALPPFSRHVWRVDVDKEDDCNGGGGDADAAARNASSDDDDDDDDSEDRGGSERTGVVANVASATKTTTTSTFQRRYVRSGLTKFSAVVRRFEQEIVEGEPQTCSAVFFHHHHAVGDKLEQMLRRSGAANFSVFRIDGAVAAADRQSIISRFNQACDAAAAAPPQQGDSKESRRDFAVAVVSVTAAGVALSFAASSLAIFVELPPDAMWLKQAEGRIHRMNPNATSHSDGADENECSDDDDGESRIRAPAPAVRAILCIDAASTFDARCLAGIFASLNSVDGVLPSPSSSRDRSNSIAATSKRLIPVQSRFFSGCGGDSSVRSPSAPSKSPAVASPAKYAATSTLAADLERRLGFVVSPYCARVHLFWLPDDNHNNNNDEDDDQDENVRRDDASPFSLCSVPMDVLVAPQPFTALLLSSGISSKNDDAAPFLACGFGKLFGAGADVVELQRTALNSVAGEFARCFLRHVKKPARAQLFAMLQRDDASSSRHLVLTLPRLRELIAASATGFVDAAALCGTALAPRRAVFERYLPRRLTELERDEWSATAGDNGDSSARRLVAQIDFFAQSAQQQHHHHRRVQSLDLLAEIDGDKVVLLCLQCREQLITDASPTRATVVGRLRVSERGEAEDALDVVVDATDLPAAEFVPFCSGLCRSRFMTQRADTRAHTDVTTTAFASGGGGVGASARLRAATASMHAGVCTHCATDTTAVLRAVVAAGADRAARMAALRREFPVLFTTLSNPRTSATIAERICARPVQGSIWHADHVLPVSQGGGAVLPDSDNLQLLCVACHANKTRTEMQMIGPRRQREGN